MSQTALRVARAALALAALAAIGYEVAEGPGVSDADYFSYFTVLSNLFAATMVLHGALRPVRERSRTVEMLRGAAVVYILTTGIVYLLLLSGHVPAYPWVMRSCITWYPYFFMNPHRGGGYLLVIGDCLAVGIGNHRVDRSGYLGRQPAQLSAYLIPAYRWARRFTAAPYTCMRSQVQASLCRRIVVLGKGSRRQVYPSLPPSRPARPTANSVD